MIDVLDIAPTSGRELGARVSIPKVLSIGTLAVALASLAVLPAWADAPAPVPNKGDTAWMLVSSALVLMMSVPGLALFYGGLVRTKNMLSVLTQVFMIVSLVSILWVVYGYSLAFTTGTPFVGSLDKLFLKGVTAASTVATFSNGVVIPEYVYICFQMTFACITPALIVGAFAERMKFSAVMLFILLWVTVVYFPIAHMVWYWDGPDAIGDAAKALAAAATPDAKAKAQAALDAVNGHAGLAYQWGALDFAGGTVVHINAGIAGLVGCIMCGRRLGHGKDHMAPHSLTMTMIGASLLWVGWFGFNAGSNLESNGATGLAFINTFVATAAAALSWLGVEWIARGKPSMLGGVTGAVAGLVAVTPASGFAGPMGSIVLGLAVSPVCFLFCSSIKQRFNYDDALDVFGVHCIGGIIGALGTGILAAPALGGAGIIDYTLKPGSGVVGAYDMAHQLVVQAKAVGLTLVWSGVGAAILYFIVDKITGLRVSEDIEREGLDLAEHGERAYSY